MKIQPRNTHIHTSASSNSGKPNPGTSTHSKTKTISNSLRNWNRVTKKIPKEWPQWWRWWSRTKPNRKKNHARLRLFYFVLCFPLEQGTSHNPPQFDTSRKERNNWIIESVSLTVFWIQPRTSLPNTLNPKEN